MPLTLETTPPAAGPIDGVAPRRTAPAPAVGLLARLASLRLTVTLFALAIFLVFAGTLAQVDHDVWYVVEENYFRVWLATIEWQAFARLVEMFTKSEPQPIAGGFWFPGGKLLGVAMFVNLLAAHAVRFKALAKGARLVAGIAAIVAGALATWGVILTGYDTSFRSELSPAFCDGLWQAVRAGVAGLGLFGAWWLARSYGRLRPAEWWLTALLNLTVLGVSGYLFAYPSAAPDESGMRIVWQLAKCGGAAALCLVGCWIVFRQRAGIVLLHAGIALLLVNELVVDLAHVEGVMSIPEGGTVNYAEDIRSVELAVVTDEGELDRVTVVPQKLLASAARSEGAVSHPDLPFDLRVVRFDENSLLAGTGESADNPATAGAGLQRIALPARSVSGVATEGGVNRPSAYVEPLDKKTGRSLGVWLVSNSFLPMPGGGGAGLLPQAVPLEGLAPGEAPPTIELRFKRLYKDYSVTLTDFRFDRYAGTNVPKNFQSDIVLRDPARGVDRPVKIWMNNPLRYAGDTLYQQSYDAETEKTTVLQVVTNTGWMIPYLSCVYVGLGMLAHFGVTLARFARRRVEEADRRAAAPGVASVGSVASWRRAAVAAPALAALVTALYFGGKARPAADTPAARAVARFGALPVAERGRVKPLDTLARTTLQAMSARQEVLPAEEGARRIPAAEWLLECLSGRDGWDRHQVFRVENLELLDALELPPRPGSFRYSYAEVVNSDGRLGDLVDVAVARRNARESGGGAPGSGPSEPPSLVERQTLALADKVSLFHQTVSAFGDPRITETSEEGVRRELSLAQRRAEQLRASEAPRVVPPEEPAAEWRTLYEAGLGNLLRLALKRPLDTAAAAWSDALTAYANGDSARFAQRLTELEEAIAKHQRSLEASPEAAAALAGSERLDASAVRFESFFSAFSPFYHCAAMYLVAFLLTSAAWLAQGETSRALSRAATAVLLVTLAVHTFALVGRVYISGRPPVTNLYSSAVFIGWAAALFGVAFESIYRLGIGSAASSLLGFSTLVVAHYLSLDGDTYTVLRAVLDTQFWLATHVVCVTLGYSTTFLAGFLGAGYLIAAAGPGLGGRPSLLAKPVADQLLRMIYGTLCFALLFSFVGTVLGGLWADDSWGRFWGWDPKENGALMIVLWNALVLHARWGRLTGPRGIATLAVFGNVVTTWSWFGVNELGVGLHAYGDSESSTAAWLLGFVASQLLVMLLALAPSPRARVAVG